MSVTFIPWLVQVWCSRAPESTLGRTWQFAGNGILVADNAVLTCLHVVRTENAVGDAEEVQVRVDGNQLMISAIMPSAKDDLALLRLNTCVRSRLPSFSTEPRKAETLGIRAWGKRGETIELQARDRVDFDEVVRERAWGFRHGMPAGFSGSPLLLDPEGLALVVGILALGGTGRAVSIAIPAAPLCEFLEAQGIKVNKFAHSQPVYDVAICYDSSEGKRAEVVCQHLKKRGLLPFGLPTKPDKGQSLSDLQLSLATCGAAVLLLSANNVAEWTRYVIRESILHSVRQRGYLLIPALVEGEPRNDLTDSIRVNRWLDLRVCSNETLEELARLLETQQSDELSHFTPAIEICPYQGLGAFTEENASFFFGREKYSKMVLEKVESVKLVGVVGASGCGKSSIVRSGVLPRLTQGGSGVEWVIMPLTPGETPVHELAVAAFTAVEPSASGTSRIEGIRLVERHFADGNAKDYWTALIEEARRQRPESKVRLLFIIDQFEEVFTLSSDTERALFLELLAAAIEVPGLQAILTLRLDYEVDARQHRKLESYLREGKIDVWEMTPEELREAIEKPAALTGIPLAPVFTERLLNDVKDQADALPLVEYALTQMWKRRPIGQLDLETGQFDTVLNAVAEGAERKLAEACPYGPEDFVVRALTRLVRLDDGTRVGGTAVHVGLDEFDKADRSILQALCAPRLLAIGKREDDERQRVRVTHEALIRSWPRLRNAVDHEREFLRWRHGISLDRIQWKTQPDRVLRGKGLKEARRWLKNRPNWLNKQEHEYIAESQKTSIRLRARALGSVFALLMVLVVIGGTLHWNSTQNELARRLASRSIVEYSRGSRTVAVLLALESLRVRWTIDGDDALQRALTASGGLGRSLLLLSMPARVSSVAWSPKGNRLAAAADDGTIGIWDASSGKVIYTLKGDVDGFTSLTWAPDGRRLAAGSFVGDHPPCYVKVWDTETGRLLLTIEADRNSVDSVAWSPDGLWLASGLYPGTIKIWDARDGHLLRTLNGHSRKVNSLAWSTDGLLASASDDYRVMIWDGKSGKLLRTEPLAGPVHSVGWQPESAIGEFDSKLQPESYISRESLAETLSGKPRILTSVVGAVFPYNATVKSGRHVLAAAAEDKTVKIWDLDTNRLIRSIAHRGSVSSVAWAPDGLRLASVSEGDVTIWDPAGQPLRTFEGSAEGEVRWSPDGLRLAVPESDGVRIWDADTASSRQLLSMLEGHESEVDSLAWTRDGTRLASASEDHTAKVWNAKTGELIISVPHHAKVASVAWSPDGHRFATGTPEEVDICCSPSTFKLRGTPLDKVDVPGRYWERVAWLSEGNQMALESSEDGVSIWDSHNGQVLRKFAGSDMAVHPKSHRLAVRDDSVGIRIWDIDTGKQVRTIAVSSLAGRERNDKSHKDDKDENNVIVDLEWSPDGRRLAAGSLGGIVRLWDVGQGTLLRTLAGHRHWSEVAWAPDGKRIASASHDGTLEVWDADSGQLLRTLEGHIGAIECIAWSPDGRLASAGDDWTIMIWTVDSNALQKAACSIVLRNLARDEWRQFVPERGYHQTCPNLPAPPEEKQ